MDQTSPAHIALLYPNDFDSAPIDDFVRAVQRPGVDLQVRAQEPYGPMAGAEWYLPTAIVLFLTQGLFNGFLGEMGKDLYAGLRKGMVSLWEAYLSRNREVELTIIGTPGKVDSSRPYSHMFAVYTPTDDGGRIKFLFRDDCEREVFDAHVEAILKALEEYHSGAPDSLLRKAILSGQGGGHTSLVRYNVAEGKLEMFNPLRERMLGN